MTRGTDKHLQTCSFCYFLFQWRNQQLLPLNICLPHQAAYVRLPLFYTQAVWFYLFRLRAIDKVPMLPSKILKQYRVKTRLQTWLPREGFAIMTKTDTLSNMKETEVQHAHLAEANTDSKVVSIFQSLAAKIFAAALSLFLVIPFLFFFHSWCFKII